MEWRHGEGLITLPSPANSLHKIPSSQNCIPKNSGLSHMFADACSWHLTRNGMVVMEECSFNVRLLASPFLPCKLPMAVEFKGRQPGISLAWFVVSTEKGFINWHLLSETLPYIVTIGWPCLWRQSYLLIVICCKVSYLKI